MAEHRRTDGAALPVQPWKCTAAKIAPDASAGNSGNAALPSGPGRPGETTFPHSQRKSLNSPILKTHSSMIGAAINARAANLALTLHATFGSEKSLTRSCGGGSNPRSNATCSETQASPIAARATGRNHFSASLTPRPSTRSCRAPLCAARGAAAPSRSSARSS